MKWSFARWSALIISLFLVCLMLVPAAGSSEDWASLSKQMRDKCANFNQEVKDLTMIMEMMNKSSEGTITTQSTLYEKGEKFRAEMTMQMPPGSDMPKEMAGMKTIVISDGTTIWLVSPMGKTQIPASEGGRYRGQWQCGDYIPTKAEIIGSETVSGHDCWILAAKDEKADFAKLWVDKKSSQLMKIESKPEKEETEVVLFSDFRKVTGDWELPYKTEVYSGKELATTIVMKSAEVNKGLADDLFNADKVQGGAKPSMMDLMKQKMQEQMKKKGGAE